MAEVHYMTQEGLDKLRKDLAEALAQRPVISAAIAEAREKGDLSENAEYDAARDAQGLLEVKIAKLKEELSDPGKDYRDVEVDTGDVYAFAEGDSPAWNKITALGGGS